MRQLLTAVLITLPIVLGSAHATEPAAKGARLGACSKEAKEKGLKGEERKAFLSECNKKQAEERKTQQEKMKSCNKDAAGKKGEERKAFMKECLSK
jgi:hypothetical protein